MSGETKQPSTYDAFLAPVAPPLGVLAQPMGLRDYFAGMALMGHLSIEHHGSGFAKQ